MTFSLIARCAQTGRFGAATTTSSIAVGARVAFVAHGVGAVLTQHRTDPRLGPRGLDLLRSGCTAEKTIAALVASTPHAAWRQLAVLDREGRGAAFTGTHTKPEHAEAIVDGAVAIGNILASRAVPEAMLTAFTKAPGVLAERLIAALEAGLAAGGEHAALHSAHLHVAGEHGFRLVDLRVDWHDAPLVELCALWTRYAPLVDAYQERALDPDTAPTL